MHEETIKVVVRRREEQGHGVVVLELVSADGRELPSFEAGAHIDLYLGNGLVRQYSLASRPGDRSLYRLGILRSPQSRGGSIAVHERLQPGTELLVGRPRNHFPLQMTAEHTVLIGGGIGITPIIAMAHALEEAGKSFELHYCARSRAACAFLDELTNGSFRERVHLHFDDGAPEQRLDLQTVVGASGLNTHLYVCGPSGFMDWVIGATGQLGLPPSHIHKEYFQAETDLRGAAFEVVAKKSGKTVKVDEGVTIVDALATVGVKVQVSCEQGVCGTCVCRVLDGVPDHRDTFLTEEEKADNDCMLLCCSRAKSDRLILDI